MKTIAIKMKNYATNVNVANNYNPERRVLNILLISLGVLAFCYVLFLGNMIFNIVERRGLETNARTLSNEVGNLESEYFSVSNKIDVSFAESIGFKETKEKQYAVRKSIGSIKLAKNEL
jgi:hypothetical protein